MKFAIQGVGASVLNVKKENRRTIYFDYLRVFATFAVVVLHLSGQHWSNTNVNGFEWQVFNGYDSFVRWSVPVFVMISGALFLERDINLKIIYSKYVLRLLASFYIWSLIYVIFSNNTLSLFEKATLFVCGHYHMWFIPMIAGLYICIPLFKAIAKDENKLKYFLCLAFVFSSVIPTFLVLANDFVNGAFLKGMVSAVKISVQSLQIHVVLGYSGYFLLGYYLNHKEFSKQQRYGIYILGIVGFLLTVFLTQITSVRSEQPSEDYYSYFSLNVLLESLAVFVFFKNRSFRDNVLITKLSKYSYGTYLVHALMIETIDSVFGINTLSFNAAAAIPAIGFVVIISSYAISALLNHVPYINKYIV